MTEEIYFIINEDAQKLELGDDLDLNGTEFDSGRNYYISFIVYCGSWLLFCPNLYRDGKGTPCSNIFEALIEV